MSGQAQTAARLLAKYGEEVTITFTDWAEYDPITGAASGSSTETTVNAVAYPSNYQTKEIDGTVIQAGDIRLILELIENIPVVGCLVLVDNKTYRIMHVKPIRLAGDNIIFICQIRAN
jgi:hypothetical protein